jgi:hypothetical protein
MLWMNMNEDVQCPHNVSWGSDLWVPVSHQPLDSIYHPNNSYSIFAKNFDLSHLERCFLHPTTREFHRAKNNVQSIKSIEIDSLFQPLDCFLFLSFLSILSSSHTHIHTLSLWHY